LSLRRSADSGRYSTAREWMCFSLRAKACFGFGRLVGGRFGLNFISLLRKKKSFEETRRPTAYTGCARERVQTHDHSGIGALNMGSVVTGDSLSHHAKINRHNSLWSRSATPD
jgi:hypothetical protein